MWIRSQDRAKLIDANEIHIELWADERSYVISDNIVVASYSSEEKALKVMDMIHRRIECAIKFYETSSIFSNESEYVFDMPKDDEV